MRLEALKEDAKRIDVRGRYQGGLFDDLGFMADPEDFIAKVELPAAWRTEILEFTIPEIRVHDVPISAFTICRSGRSRWARV